MNASSEPANASQNTSAVNPQGPEGNGTRLRNPGTCTDPNAFWALLFNALAGKKTHGTCVLLLVLLFGSWQGWWQLPPEIDKALLALALIFLRTGVSREIKQTQNPETPNPDEK